MNKICHYDSMQGELSGSIYSKARKFNRLKLIEKTSEHTWLVKPIPHYNKTIYTVIDNGQNDWICTCQASVIEKRICSHIISVSLFIKNQRGEGIENY